MQFNGILMKDLILIMFKEIGKAMNNPETLKIILYTSLGVISLVGTVLGIGVWIGKKNHDSEEINKLKQAIELNEAKAKARFYTPGGAQIMMRAEICEKLNNAVRADILRLDKKVTDVEKKQATYESTLESIDGNVKMLVGLFEAVVKKQ